MPVILGCTACRRGSSCWIRKSLRAWPPSNSVMCRDTVWSLSGEWSSGPLTGAGSNPAFYLRGNGGSGIIGAMGITTKDEPGIQGMRTACRLAAEVLDHLTPFIKPGLTTREIDRLAAEFMKKQGTISATLR